MQRNSRCLLGGGLSCAHPRRPSRPKNVSLDASGLRPPWTVSESERDQRRLFAPRLGASGNVMGLVVGLFVRGL